MKPQKILLIVLVLLVRSLFILIILTATPSTTETQEPFSFFPTNTLFINTSPETELADLQENNRAPINNLKKENNELALSQYFIKGAYNCAQTGNNINLQMVKYLLTRGVRFLDTEIYLSTPEIDDDGNPIKTSAVPIIAVSNDLKNEILATNNSATFSNFLKILVQNAFDNTIAPNYQDPVFLHLRITTDKDDICNKISALLRQQCGNRLYPKTITSATNISHLLGGKIVVLIDKTATPSTYLSTCKDTSWINAETGTNDISISYATLFLGNKNTSPITPPQYTTPPLAITTTQTDKSTFVITKPLDTYPTVSRDTRNPTTHELNDLILSYGVNVILYKFHELGDGLEEYENVFNDNHASIIPYTSILRYINEYNNTGQTQAPATPAPTLTGLMDIAEASATTAQNTYPASCPTAPPLAFNNNDIDNYFANTGSSLSSVYGNTMAYGNTLAFGQSETIAEPQGGGYTIADMVNRNQALSQT